MVSATISVNVAAPLQPPTSSSSVACTVNVNVPVAVAVPDRTPLAESDTPVGKAPLATWNVYGSMPPLAVNGCE